MAGSLFSISRPWFTHHSRYILFSAIAEQMLFLKCTAIERRDARRIIAYQISQGVILLGFHKSFAFFSHLVHTAVLKAGIILSFSEMSKTET